MSKITRNITNDNLQYSKLWRCRSLKELAQLLETTEEFLQEFAYDTFSHDLLQKHYNIYTTKKGESDVRYIEEPIIYRYYIQDYFSKGMTKKSGTIEKYCKGQYEPININNIEYEWLQKQAEEKRIARVRRRRGISLKNASYVDIGLKEVQRVICDVLTSSILNFKGHKIWMYKYPEYLHSGVKYRSAKTQMQYLKDQKNNHWDLYDIEKFYQNVLYTDIKTFFKKTMQCNNSVAKVLANIASFDGAFYVEYKKLEGKELKAMVQTKHIMTGSPLSQKLSFLCFKELFDNIHNICVQNNGKFGLYVDDLTLTNATKDVKKQIILLVDKYGLKIKKEKIKHIPVKLDKENLGIKQDCDKDGLIPSKRIITKMIQNRTKLKKSNAETLIDKSSKELHEMSKKAKLNKDKHIIDTIKIVQKTKGLGTYTKYLAK